MYEYSIEIACGKVVQGNSRGKHIRKLEYKKN